MSQPPPRRPRPAAPTTPDYSADATGLNSLPVDPDTIDDLAALAASVAAPTPMQRPAVARPVRRSTSSSLRETVVPLLLTGGLICIALAIAWWSTDADSPYRRVSVALPIVLLTAGLLLLAGGVVNMLMIKRDLSARATRGPGAN